MGIVQDLVWAHTKIVVVWGLHPLKLPNAQLSKLANVEESLTDTTIMFKFICVSEQLEFAIYSLIDI
jgi:hypothetical protein